MRASFPLVPEFELPGHERTRHLAVIAPALTGGPPDTNGCNDGGLDDQVGPHMVCHLIPDWSDPGHCLGAGDRPYPVTISSDAAPR